MHRRGPDLLPHRPGDSASSRTGLQLPHLPRAYLLRWLGQTGWLEGDPIYLAKKALLEETGMTVYRTHDRLHSNRPDGIFTGVVKKLGWEKYALSDEFMPSCCFDLPPTTVAGVAEQLARAMHIGGMRIIGDPDMEVERAAVVFHFLGTDMDKEVLRFVKENGVQVLIPGEVVDWTVGEYVQDGLFFGRKLALLNPGHFN